MMAEKQASIIFILGQAQNIILPDLLEHIGGGTIKIFTVYPVKVAHDVKVINIKPSSLKDSFVMILEIWCMLWGLRKYSRVKLYTPHILNFLVNKTYYKLSTKCELYYLFDGILNYRSVRADAGNMQGYQKKQALKSLFLLHKYRPVRGEVVNQELEGVAGLYVPSGVLIDKLKFSRPVHVLQTNISQFVPLRRVLVLEPPLLASEVNVFKDKLLKLITEQFLGFDIFIKRHPSMLKSNINIDDYRGKHGINIQHVNEASPAELIYQELKCAAVISTNSSALLMIKTNFPSSEVYSINVDASSSDTSLMEVENIMRSSGVIFI